MGGASDAWTTFATRILAANPGPMTLDGTNTYIVRHPGSHRVAVVDPGPRDPLHLQLLTAHGDVELILLTHHHRDHSESARALAARTGAAVRAADPALCDGAPPLEDGEELWAGGVRIIVLATPGHCEDSLSFHLPDDRPIGGSARTGSMLTGDTILGRGTSVIAAPDGSLSDYLQSLHRLRTFGDAVVLPGHGPQLDALAPVASAYLAHRARRLEEVAAAVDALAELHAEVTVQAVTRMVYTRVPSETRPAAEASVKAQLNFLRQVSMVIPENIEETDSVINVRRATRNSSSSCELMEVERG